MFCTLQILECYLVYAVKLMLFNIKTTGKAIQRRKFCCVIIIILYRDVLS